MKLVPYGAAGGNVIPSRIFLQGKDAEESILLDCGDAIPEKGEKNHRIDFGSLRPSIVKKILVSHGHTDHVGALPAFVQAGFKGEIESTQGTQEITSALIRDNYPQALVNDVFDRYQKPRKYLERFEIADGVYATFYPARGHILEASSILLEFERLKLRVLFTGDLGNNKMMLDINGAIPKVDIVISESTYGHREHHPDFNLSLEQLHEGIRNTCRNEGNFFIPVLSINKLQEVLFHVNLAREKGDIPNDVNVVVDSTLGEAITRIYNKPYFRHLYSLDAIKFFNSYSKVYPFAYTNRAN